MKKYILVIFTLLALGLCGCGIRQKTMAAADVSDMNSPDHTIGVVDGYIFEDALSRALPKAAVMHFDSRETAYMALRTGQVEALADDEAIIRAISRSTDIFTTLDGYVEPSDYAIAFPKTKEGSELCRQMSRHIGDLRNSGRLAELDEKWFGSSTENKKSKDPALLTGKNKTLRAAFDDSNIPFAYLSAGKPAGYDIDILISFCEEYGYGLEIVKTSFTDMLQGVESGVYDLGCGAITITEQRKQTLSFSEPDYSGGICICVCRNDRLPSDALSEPAFIRHFRNSFLTDANALLLIRGLATTLLLTALAAVFGFLLGTGLFILSCRGNLFLRILISLLLRLIYGVPAAMLIMILYYAYYEPVYQGAFFACLVGFTMLFANRICFLIRKNGGYIDNGRLYREYRLEGIDHKEFYEALKKKAGVLFVEDFRDSLVLLLKTTSLAGYISATDLTRVFELIRTRSYEIAMPLFVITAIYFILIQLICVVFNRFLRSVKKPLSTAEQSSFKTP